MQKIIINPNKAFLYTINLDVTKSFLQFCSTASPSCIPWMENFNKDCISRTGPWTTTSSYCRSTRSPTWSAPPTSSTGLRSSPKVVINPPQPRSRNKSSNTWWWFGCCVGCCVKRVRWNLKPKLKKISNSDFLVVGVTVSELSFTDGSAPAQDIVDKWLCLVNKVTLIC